MIKCPKCGNDQFFYFYTIISYEADLSVDEFIKNDENWHHATCGKCGKEVEIPEEILNKFWRGT